MNGSDSQRDAISKVKTKVDYYPWVILLLSLGVTLSNNLSSQGIPVLYPFIQNEFSLSRAQIGLITSAYSIGMLITLVPAGWLTDSFGVKRMIAISLSGLAALTIAFLLAPSFIVILALTAIIGAVTSPGFTASTRAIIEWLPARFRALAMSAKQTGVPIAGALSAAALPALTVVVGWRMAAAVTGILVLAIAIVFMSLYRDASETVKEVHRLNRATLRAILQRRGLVIAIIWGSIFVGLQYIILSYFMLFLIDKLKLSPLAAGGVLAISQFSSGIARILWGAASDFIFHRRRVVVLAIAGFLTVLWTLGASLISVDVPRAAVYSLAIVIGISTFSFHGVWLTLIGELSDVRHVGVTIGIGGTANNVARIILPPLFGYIVDVSGSYSLGWGISAATALVFTLALLVFGREPQRN